MVSTKNPLIVKYTILIPEMLSYRVFHGFGEDKDKIGCGG